jgi:hypothetical protein
VTEVDIIDEIRAALAALMHFPLYCAKIASASFSELCRLSLESYIVPNLATMHSVSPY